MKERRRGRGGREGQRMTGKDEELGEREKKEQEQEEEEGSLSSSSHICILICIIPISLNFS